MPRILTFLAALLASAASASADCVGTGQFQSCYDAQSGNSYTVQRSGNITTVYGNNARTGSNWSQQSYAFGSTTIHQGTDKDGNAWQTTCHSGNCD